MLPPELHALRIRLLVAGGALMGVIYLALLALGGRAGLEFILSTQQLLCVLMSFVILVAVWLARD